MGVTSEDGRDHTLKFEEALEVGDLGEGSKESQPEMIWCEHCRDFYDREHYSDEDGMHFEGAEFGDYGLLLQKARVYDEVSELLARRNEMTSSDTKEE